jgi:hypothetical protein
VHRRETWRRAHFDALLLFGVLQSHAGGVTVASLDVLATSAPSSSFLSELKTAQQQDLFLQGVGEEVDCSDHGAWRDFRRNEQGFLCYQREGDETQRICVPRLSRDAVLHVAHGDALTGHPGRVSLVRWLILRSFFGGQTCSETWLILFEVAVRVRPLKALRG